MEWFYDFRMGGKRRGWSYLRIGPSLVFSLTRFLLPDGAMYENRFETRLSAGIPVSCRRADGPWFDVADGQFPGSAYELLLDRVGEGPLAYQQVSEEEGTVVEAVLRSVGEVIEESVAGEVVRRFTRQEGVTVEVDWGGAMSALHDSGDSAATGSGVPFTLE